MNVTFSANFTAFRAKSYTIGTVTFANNAKSHTITAQSAAFTSTATFEAATAARTFQVFIVYIAGTAFAGRVIFQMAFQTGIITAVIAHAAAIKTAEANHAVGASIETFTAFSAMSIVFYGTIKAHFASITPIAAFAAGLIAHRTTRCVAQTCSAAYTVVCFVAIAAAGLAAVLAAVADVVISNKRSAKLAICHRIPCI